MRYKTAFVVLLAMIIVVGIKGTDIAGLFFSSSALEETTIARDSVKSNVIYIASPDEISFNPMEVIDNDDSVPENAYTFSESGALVCAAMIESLSRYYEKSQYASPVSYDIYSSLKYSYGADCFYLDKYQYLNAYNETRYADCIISRGDYRIIYLNFYSDEEYDLEADDISKGLKKFQENSEDFYLDTDLYTGASDNKYVLFLNSAYLGGNNVKTLLDAYETAFEAFDSIGYVTNTVEYFWFRSLVLNTVNFYDESMISDSEICWDSEQEFYETPVYGTLYIFELLGSTYDFFNNNGVYNSGESSFAEILTDNTEYAAYNGRIYQTIKFTNIYNYTDTLIVIYNIDEDIIEGFYAPPTHLM